MKYQDPAGYHELHPEYEILEEVGRGASVVVHRARDRELGRDVALKIAGPAAADRLRREAAVLGRLQHSNIVTLYGVRRAGDDVVLIRQFVAGCTLRDLLNRGEPLPVDRVTAIVEDIGSALAYAHARGVVHGAVTADTILIEAADGRALLIGFGAARLSGVEPAGRSEQSGQDRQQPQGDLYSLALVAHQMLTGARAGAAVDPGGAAGPPLPLELLRPDLPERVRVAIDGALRETADRWADVPEFLGALAGRIGPRRRPPRRAAATRRAPLEALLTAVTAPSPGRRRAAVVAAVCLAIAAGVLGAAGLKPWQAPLDMLARFAALSKTDGEIAPPLAGEPAVVSALETGSALPDVDEPRLAYALFGDWQHGFAGDTLPEQLVLRVENAAGRPVAGAHVRFAVTLGDGTVSDETVITDDFGLASTWWIPAGAGNHEVEARVLPSDRGDIFRANVSLRPSNALAAGPAPARAVAVGADRPSGPAGSTGAVPAADARLAVRAGMALGGTHSCLLRPDGRAFCWGGNDQGQLGDGTRGRRLTATPVGDGDPLAALAAGVAHSCALARSGLLYCWGGNASGQLGDGTTAQRAQPVRVASAGVRFDAVAAGLAHTCALTTGGDVYCWGMNTHGQLGDGSARPRSRPGRAGTRRYRSIALGWSHSCALATDGEAYCWGRNRDGELGDGSMTDRTNPVAVAGGHRFTAIAAGSYHTCGVRTDGVVLCWGQNSHGQLGTGDAQPALVPAPISGDARYVALALGGVHSCALSRDGVVDCWGRNTYGQLGDGTTADRAVPTPVLGGLRFSAVYASGAHSCATTTNGRDVCWGFNADGQLGTGARANQSRPAAIVTTW